MHNILNHFHKHNVKYVLVVFGCSFLLSIIFLIIWIVLINQIMKTNPSSPVINYRIFAYQALFSIFLSLTFNSFCQATYLSFIKKATQRKLDLEEENKVLLERAVNIVTTKAPTLLAKWFGKKPPLKRMLNE